MDIDDMTLRDWFAGQVLPAIQRDTPASIAKAAYEVADAMMTERIQWVPADRSNARALNK